MPQWSRPRIGRMTQRLMPEEGADQLAAMEPAEDRPDDHGPRGRVYRGRHAAMEPAEDRPDDMPARPGARRGKKGAAMEPAEDRPDDLTVPPLPVLTTCMPQWSRPRIGRMTSPPTPSPPSTPGRNGAGRGSAG